MNGDTSERRIAEWRTYLHRHRAIHAPDVEELEGHLRDQAATLRDAGLADDEAFLIAVKRVGEIDDASREFGRAHFERSWGPRAPAAVGDDARAARTETIVVLGLATAAALAIKIPELFGYQLFGDLFEGGDMGFYVRNLSLFVLPMLTAYFAWKRRLSTTFSLWLALPFVGGAVFANVFPFTEGGSTGGLTALHLPIALWLVVGIAYTGGRWGSVERRMDFVRFSGELFIYYVLIALGGGVFTGLTWGMFEVIGLDVKELVQNWLLPCGATGAVVVSAWLVENRQGAIDNIAPMLARVFTPLFALMLLALLAAMVVTGWWMEVEREMLIGLDLMLVLVLGLLLFSVSAHGSQARPGGFHELNFLLVAVALVVDVLALTAIATRIFEFGFSPNKTAALGENVIMLGNLAWSAWLYARFLFGKGPFSALERWQTAYLPVYVVWAGIVVIVFPPLFGYI